MEPSLVDGSFVLYFRSSWLARYLQERLIEAGKARGWSFLVNHPRLGKIVKRCVRYDPKKQEAYLAGTHPGSTTLQQLGAVPQSCFEGVVLLVLATQANQNKLSNLQTRG